MAALVWIDLYDAPNQRGRLRRILGPGRFIVIRAVLAPIRSVAAGPQAYVRLFDSAHPGDAIAWLRPSGVIAEFDAMAGASRFDGIELRADAPARGQAGYERYVAQFSLPNIH